MQSERVHGARQEPAEALRAVVDEIESLFAAKEYERAAEAIDRNLLEAWYGQRPERLAAMLGEIVAAGVPISPITTAILIMADPEGEARYQQDDVQEVLARPGSLEATVMLVGRALKLRIVGRSKDAYALFERMVVQKEPVQPIMDQHAGWHLFATLQRANTALLAGDFQAALALFAQGQFQVPVPTLPFLTRDAYVKYALVHACVGDPALASVALRSAAELPRTESWVEDVIDAAASVAEAILTTDENDEAANRLLAIPMHFLGEMWPFYAFGLQKVLERSGKRASVTRQLEMLDMTSLPRVDGQGFSGSVIPATLAANAIIMGNVDRARELIARADPDVPTTKIVEIMLALITGRTSDALRLASQLQPAVKGLRQLELWRYGTITGAHLAAGDTEGALGALRGAVALSGELSPEEAGFFPAAGRQLARGKVDGWPQGPDVPYPNSDGMSSTHASLTKREVEVLQLVAQELSREEIAAQLFLSANTVKAHWRSVYRKLGVTSRSAALIEAERRGLI